MLAEGRETDARAASDAAGAGLALTRAVLDFALGRRRPTLAPRALIERYGVSFDDARAGGGGEGLRAALAELADAAEARFDEAEARLAALPAALAPAFAPLATARLDLKRWRGAGAAPFAPPRRGGGNGRCGFGRGGVEAGYSFAIWPRVSPPLFLAVWMLK